MAETTKTRRGNRSKATRERQARRASVYTLSTPNEAFEGYFLDGKVRFIEGKAKITDELARKLTYRVLADPTPIGFENAEELARYLMQQYGMNTPGRDDWTCSPALPPLPTLQQGEDEYNPNAVVDTRRRGSRRRGSTHLLEEARPAGMPAGADPAEAGYAPRQKEKVAS